MFSLAFFEPGVGQLIIILGIALLIFGGRLPSVAKNLGKSIVEFKKGMNSGVTDTDTEAEEEPAPPARKNPARLAASTPKRKSLPSTEEV